MSGYLVCLAVIARADSWMVQPLFAGLATIFIGRLFVLGHDACHQSLTPSRRLNRWLGTLAFLPSLHPFSLWDLGHNRIHHRYTNQRGLDYVWEPLEPEEYRRLRRGRAGVSRLPHAARALGLLRRGDLVAEDVLPAAGEIGGYRREYVWDHVLIAAWTLALPAGLVALRLHWAGPADAGRTSPQRSCGVGSCRSSGSSPSMSTIIYLHHTHPSVVWTRPADTPENAQLAGAVHVVLPAVLERTLHQIMDHPAHHVRPGIPLYRLSGGEALLESGTPTSSSSRGL